MMKKFITFFLVVVLVLSMTACSNTPDTTETDCGTTGTPHEHEETTTTDATTSTTPSHDDFSEETEPDNTVSTDPVDDPDHTAPTENTIPSETIDTHKHNYTTTVTNATCTEDGYTTYVCDCGDTYTADFVEATGHVWGDWVTVKAATEDATGEAVRTCSVCGGTEKKDLPKLIAGHTHSYTSSVTKQPTCTAEGVKTYTCSCGDSYTEKIAKTAHNYTTTVTPPSCLKRGYTTYTCSCGNSYKDNYIDAFWHHSYTSKVTTAATCVKDGVMTYTCSRCGHSYTEAIEATRDHSWGEWETTKKPTDNETGTEQRTCSVCGKVETETLKKLPHTHSYTSSVTREATCNDYGERTYTCSCGHSYSESLDERPEHKFTVKDQILSKAALEYYDRYNWYMVCDEYTVTCCEVCGCPDEDSIEYIYENDPVGLATKMLEYVNELRREVLGEGYDLVLDPKLIELAQIRSVEIKKEFAHTGTPTNAGENISIDAPSVSRLFNSWKESSGHYANMVYPDYKYFGFAMYTPNLQISASTYGVQLFWSENSRKSYYMAYT